MTFPTAQESVAVTHLTDSSSLNFLAPVPAGSGVVTWSHFLPFQCRASFWAVPPKILPPVPPTAQQLLADEQVTPISSLLSPLDVPPGCGTPDMPHFRPFHRKTSFSTLDVEAMVTKTKAQTGRQPA